MYIDEENLIPETLVIGDETYDTLQLLNSTRNMQQFRRLPSGEFKEFGQRRASRPQHKHEISDLFFCATNTPEAIAKKYGVDRKRATELRGYSRRALTAHQPTIERANRELPPHWMKEIILSKLPRGIKNSC